MTDNSITTFHSIPPVHFSRFEAVTVDPYSSGVRHMAGQAGTVTWDSFKWVVSGLLGLICVLVTGAFLWMRDDLGEVKRDIRDLTKELSVTRLDLTKAIGAVERQAAGTNSRLDQLIADGRQRR
jgi:hypothetical protein